MLKASSGFEFEEWDPSSSYSSYDSSASSVDKVPKKYPQTLCRIRFQVIGMSIIELALLISVP